MAKNTYLVGDKEELLDKLLKTADPGSPVFEAQKVAIAVRCVDELGGGASRSSPQPLTGPHRAATS